MLKAFVAATAAVTIAGSGLAYAQPGGRADGGRRWRPSTEDMRAFQAARLAGLRAGLELNPDQEKYWPAFEQAMRDLQQLRLNRITAFRERRGDGQSSTDPAERMRERANRLAESGDVLKRLADATGPLYRSLDDAQKRRFAFLTRAHGMRAWRRPGHVQPGLSRGHQRTQADTPHDPVAHNFASKTLDSNVAGNELSGNVFAHAFAGKTVDGVIVGRVFGTKTVDGDLAVGEVMLFDGKLTASEPGLFGRKLTAGGAVFGRKIMIGEPGLSGRKALTDI